MKNKINLLVYSPIPSDSVSSWRCTGPIALMERQYPNLNIRYIGDQATWIDMLWADVVMVHRPFLPNHVNLMNMIKDFNIPIWMDIDDDLFHVPLDNPTYFNYSRPEVQQSIRQCLQLADYTTVTTQALADLYKPYIKKYKIIPNGWDVRLMQPWDKTQVSKTITWRGSDSHKRDLAAHMPGIIGAINNTPQHQWKFIGYHAWEIPTALGMPNFGGRVNWVPGQQFWTYYRTFKLNNPDINIVPLANDIFNQCKSNISWLETAIAGGVSVVPNWPSWDVPGAFKYNTTQELQDITIALSKDNEKVLKGRAQALEYIKEVLPLDKLNIDRMNVIEELLS